MKDYNFDPPVWWQTSSAEEKKAVCYQSTLVERAGGVVNLTVLVPRGLQEVSQGRAGSRHGNSAGRGFLSQSLVSTEPGSS